MNLLKRKLYNDLLVTIIQTMKKQNEIMTLIFYFINTIFLVLDIPFWVSL